MDVKTIKCQGCSDDACRCEAEILGKCAGCVGKNANVAMNLKHAAGKAMELNQEEVKSADAAMAAHIKGKEELRSGFEAGTFGQAQQAQTQMQQQQQTARAAILNEAMKITHHDRNANYGNPEDNFKNIAALWNAYWTPKRLRLENTTGSTPEFGAEDVAIMNMLIKVARLCNNPNHHDSAVDIAGYAACLGDIQASKSAVGR